MTEIALVEVSDGLARLCGLAKYDGVCGSGFGFGFVVVGRKAWVMMLSLTGRGGRREHDGAFLLVVRLWVGMGRRKTVVLLHLPVVVGT